jgi:hypothetical protein
MLGFKPFDNSYKKARDSYKVNNDEQEKKMNQTVPEHALVEDRFAVAQVALYLFAILQVVAILMTVTGAVPLGIVPEASTTQRLSTIATAVVNILCFAVGYVLLARCLNRCTRLVWRIAFTVFLLNGGVAALAIAAQPNPYPVLTCSLAVAGAISVWNGRRVIKRNENSHTTS